MRARWRSFSPRLVAIVAVALAVRLIYALVIRAGEPVTGDGREFHLLAQVLAEEGRYLQPFRFLFQDVVVPTAEKPILYPLALAPQFLLGLEGYAAHQVLDSLLGAATVGAIGLLGRRVGGEAAGLAAAALAAVFPMMVILAGSARSESLYALLVALVLLAAYRLLDRPGSVRAASLGALVGLATLARSEALLMLVVVVAPAVLLLPRGSRLVPLAVATLSCVLVVAPWFARNWITFDRPALSTNEGGLLLGANCEAAYFSPQIGTWPCFTDTPRSWGTNEAEISSRNRALALDYVEEHTGRLPAVIAVRVLRTWELYQPFGGNAQLERTANDRSVRVQQAGVVGLWLLAPLALFGALALRRRGRPLRLLLAPVLLVTVVVALTYGSSRFRAAADVSLVVLGGVGAVELAGRLRRSPGPA